MEEQITISKSEYEALVEDSEFLERLSDTLPIDIDELREAYNPEEK